MLDGEQRYWPESSGETLANASVSTKESFPVLSNTVVRPVPSVVAPTIQLFSPFPSGKHKVLEIIIKLRLAPKLWHTLAIESHGAQRKTV